MFISPDGISADCILNRPDSIITNAGLLNDCLKEWEIRMT